MRRKKLEFLLIILLIILSFCNKKENLEVTEINIHDNSYQVSVVKEKEVRVDVITKFTPDFAKIDDPEHILIMFKNGQGNWEIYKYDIALQFQNSFTIKSGQGPKEAINPLVLGGTTEEIVIYDIGYRRLSFWNSTFDNCLIEKRTLISNNLGLSGFGYSPKSGYILIWEDIFYRPGKKNRIKVYLKDAKKKGTSGLTLHELEYTYLKADSNSKLQFWPSYPFHAILLKDFVFLVNLREYLVYKYDLEGNLLIKVKVKFPHKEFSSTQLKEWKKSFGFKTKANMHFPGELWPACWLLPFDKGFVVGRRENYKASKEEWITADYFEMSCRYLGKIKLPWFRRWNHPLLAQNAVDYFIFVKDGKMFMIHEEEGESEAYLLSKWILKNDE
jgi:hypothetical protein